MYATARHSYPNPGESGSHYPILFRFRFNIIVFVLILLCRVRLGQPSNLAPAVTLLLYT